MTSFSLPEELVPIHFAPPAVSRLGAVVAAALLLLLSGCGGGGGAVPGPTSGAPPPSPPPMPSPPPSMPNVSVPTDLPVLFLEVSTDISDYNNVIGEIIDGNLQNFIQFVPATDETAIVATNPSLSYAESVSTLKVSNDRIFLLNVADTGARIAELNPDAMLEPADSFPIPTPRSQDSVSENCLAIVADDLIYKVAHREAAFPATGFDDGPLVRVPNLLSQAGPSSLEILVNGLTGSGTSPSSGGFVTDACRGYFDVDGDSWIDTDIGFPGGQRSFYRKDLRTGTPQLVASLPDPVPLIVSKHAYDDGAIYFAGLDTTGQAFALWFGDINGQVAATSTISIADLTTNFVATGLQLLDADDGYVAFVLDGVDRDVVILYEPISDVFSAFDKGGRVNQLQLLHRGS